MKMNEQLAFYFWLGEDGEPVSLQKEEFEKKVEEEREMKRRRDEVILDRD